ncbi:MAG: flagellar export protein FliJ [Peptostreptococcaceae bacterium]|nr:flagellar export protein FliJ [Peptostreptococcaceae bacterium]
MKFKFKFQKILEAKERMEDAKKNEFAKKIQEIEAIKESVLLLDQEKEELKIKYQRELETGMDINSAKRMNSYFKIMDDKKTYYLKLIEIKNNELEIIKNEYLSLMKDRKSFENLKEKDFNEFREQEKIEEAKTIDELVSFKATKK